MSLNRGSATGSVVAGSGVTLLARLRGQGGQHVTQASLSSIGYTVSDLQAGAIIATGTFTVSSTIFDSLQQFDPRWTMDSQAAPGADGSWGYNFLAGLPASALPQTTLTSAALYLPPPRVQVDVLFTPLTGEVFRVVWSFSPVRTWK